MGENNLIIKLPDEVIRIAIPKAAALQLVNMMCPGIGSHQFVLSYIQTEYRIFPFPIEMITPKSKFMFGQNKDNQNSGGNVFYDLRQAFIIFQVLFVKRNKRRKWNRN